jgi:hypothetical protein
MARMPGATWRPLGSNPAVEGTMARYDILCYHTMVGSLWGTDSYFRQGGYSGTESHFGVGYDGQILQWQDTRYRADANLDGGDRVLSVETADMGPGFPAWSGSNVPRWTAAQIEANARIAVWANRIHGIPLVLIPNSAQSSRGLGWHRQGIDPWRCSTCERWSSSSGKVCPGDRRVAQMPRIIARAQQIVSGTPTPGDDDMPLNQADLDNIYLVVRNVIQHPTDGKTLFGNMFVSRETDPTMPGPEKVRAIQELADAKTIAMRLETDLADLKVTVDAILAKLETPPA